MGGPVLILSQQAPCRLAHGALMPLGMKRPAAAPSALAKWPFPAEPEARATVCGDSRHAVAMDAPAAPPPGARDGGPGAAPARTPVASGTCWGSEPGSAAGLAHRTGPGRGLVDMTPKAGDGGRPRICRALAGRARSWQTQLTPPRLAAE